MHHFARRTAGFTALIAAAGLIAVGCSSDDNDNKAGDAAASITSAAGGALGGESSTEGAQPSESGASGESGAPSSGAEAGGETKVSTPNGEITVAGGIYEKYIASGGPEGTLGAPLQEQESAPEDGKFQDFTGGTIYQPKDGDAHIVWGEIRKAWEDDGGAGGQLGYPVSDEQDIPGGKQSDFTGGTITWVDGQTNVQPK